MRVHLSAEARCKQIERLVADEPGATISRIVERTGMAYTSVCAYTTRLVREHRIEAVSATPAKPGCRARQLFYPPGHASARQAA